MAFSVYQCNPWPSQSLSLTGDLAAASKTVRGGVANLTVAGTTTANSVSVSALSNAGTTISTTLTPSGGSFSGPLKLPVGIHTVTITAGTTTRTRQVYVPHGHFGINGHPDYDTTAWSAANWVSFCNSIGAKTIRMNSFNSDSTMSARIVALMNYFWTNNTGISILPCISINPYLTDATSSNNTEDANYTLGFNCGQLVATRFQAAFYECGNEIYTRGAGGSNPVLKVAGNQGDTMAAYATPGWKCVRGLQRGLIDGVKSVQPNAQCGANFVAAQIAAADMLWTGTNPDGTVEPTKAVKFDFITWHNYKVQGSMFSIGTNGHGSNFDVLNYLRTSHTSESGATVFFSADGTNPLPVHITEWNSNPEDSDTTGATWMNQEMPKFFARRGNGNSTPGGSGIESVSYYQAAHDGLDFGMDDRPNKAAAYLAFVNANPDT